MSLPIINFIHLTVSEIQSRQTLSSRQPNCPPTHPDTMGENNTLTALKGCGVKTIVLLWSKKKIISIPVCSYGPTGLAGSNVLRYCFSGIWRNQLSPDPFCWEVNISMIKLQFTSSLPVSISFKPSKCCKQSPDTAPVLAS